MRDQSRPAETTARLVEVKAKNHAFSPKQQIRHFQDAFEFLKSNRTLALVVFTFMANRLGRQGITLLVRYASKRYDWEIKQAAYLLSFRAATNLAAVATFLPLTNYVLLNHVRLPAHWADLWIARGSIILTAVSFLVIGLAAHPALLNQLFQWGMGLGSVWLGLPFLTAMFVFAGLSFKIDVSAKEVAYAEVQSDDEDDVFECQGRASTSALEQEGMHRQSLSRDSLHSQR
ncbi:uncharacterized protein M421DRAFT_366455 [Didymella exigua CBS 183.55]|uniref:MFS general substrate transporter n=1 Tax=Didymella exigua CBS 183.55 TaxID=1150837 RepID=A0A6A5R5I0_9PLEO|nr:uncharacterized protein M421DRAFT_366455 [Didymella exigua CBS 183.55]KAF1922440.1 hypothetical protein M421DRAFT_366455 [Didymella exigua CBS 183.55]